VEVKKPRPGVVYKNEHRDDWFDSSKEIGAVLDVRILYEVTMGTARSRWVGGPDPNVAP
jgi:hypothetical protein